METKQPSETHADGVSAEPRTGRRRALAGLAAVSAAALGAASMQREAHAGPMGFGHHGPGGWHGGMGPMGPMDPATMGKRIEAMVAFMLADIDVTPEQRERIVAIAKGVAADMESSREQHMKLRRESLQLFAAPTIDATALEKLRAEQMKLGEAASRRMLAAMIEGAKVLTTEQRAKLVERRQRRMPPPK